MRAICSGHGHVLDERGNVVMKLGHEKVPHGQEVRVGRFRSGDDRPQMILRWNGHSPDILVVDVDGTTLAELSINPAPNNTGMETVRWGGDADLLYSPAALFDGRGCKVVTLPDLPPSSGGKMGWDHCFAADVCGDEREEVVLYDPYGAAVYIYTAAPLAAGAFGGYQHGTRQCNARLLD